MTESSSNSVQLPVGDGWVLLKEGDKIKKGDGFVHPDCNYWIDYACRPDLFRVDREFVHTWPWRRKV